MVIKCTSLPYNYTSKFLYCPNVILVGPCAVHNFQLASYSLVHQELMS